MYMADIQSLLPEYNQNTLKYLSNANNPKNISLQGNVQQLNEQSTKTFTLLIIWFIITIFIFVVTMLTLINESSLNPIVMIIVTLFLFYVLYYFTTSLYNMFK